MPRNRDNSYSPMDFARIHKSMDPSCGKAKVPCVIVLFKIISQRYAFSVYFVYGLSKSITSVKWCGILSSIGGKVL